MWIRRIRIRIRNTSPFNLFFLFFVGGGRRQQQEHERVPGLPLRDRHQPARRHSQAHLPLELPDQHTQRLPVGQGQRVHRTWKKLFRLKSVFNFFESD
jgi:hypothetical protein